MEFKTKVKKVASNLYLKFGRFIGIDIINVLCISMNEQSKYNKHLRDGINEALHEIPYMVCEVKVRTILENALYNPINKEEKKINAV